MGSSHAWSVSFATANSRRATAYGSSPCNSIHSIGMKFDFDAVFLDKELRVVHLMHAMKTVAYFEDGLFRA